MADFDWHAAERTELAKIDYFLDQLARAVERGEIPMSSYQTLAPRYLTRREDLVAVLTRVSRPASPPEAAGGTAPAAVAQAPATAAVHPGPAAGARQEFSVDERSQPGVQRAAVSPVARPARKPVAWTTVLLFLGAFLVIVASAIFALAVWNQTGVAFRLGFLGTLTAVFYGAGYVARTKFELRAGSVALTVVGSAMLLFDCWILISGLSLSGPLPWAAALFLCSAVYWLTEVRLGDRFYGIAGTAAQAGWWWLMSSGMGLENPVRLAGLAVIALAWHLVAERAEESPTFGSLATVLLWSAPLVVVAASVGIARDAILVGTTTWTVAGCAAVVSGSAAAVMWRTRLVGDIAARWIAGLCQVPLFIVVLLPGVSSWFAVSALALAAAVYAFTALAVGGTPFAMAAFGMELLATLAALSLLDASDAVRLGALAVLSVTWAGVASLAEGVAERPAADRWRGARETALVAEVSGFALLLATSVLVPVTSGGVPLASIRVDANHAILAGIVLAAWAASSVVRRNPVTAFIASIWSFYVVAAVAAWAFPGAHSAVYATALLAVASAWLPARGALSRSYGLDEVLFGWVMRGLALAFVYGGLVAERLFFDTAATWQGVVLCVVAAVLFLADSEFSGPTVSAGLGSALAVSGAYLGGVLVGDSGGAGAFAAAGAGALLALLGAGVRALERSYASWLAAAAAAAATLACVAGTRGWALVGAFVLASLAWAVASFASRYEQFALLAGLMAFGACAAGLAAGNPVPSVTVAVLGVMGLLLGVPAFLQVTGVGGPRSRTGGALAFAGLAGLSGVAGVGFLTSAASGWGGASFLWGAASDARWMSLGGQNEVFALLILGGYVVAQAQRWRIEPGTYIGWAVIACALLVEFGHLGYTTIELYSTCVALYFAAMGELYARRAQGRSVPLGIDVVTILVGLGIPAQAALAFSGAEGAIHMAWVVGLALAAIGAGVGLRVRTYFIGGVAAMVLVVGFKSLSYLAQVWWVLLGVIGVSMLVIALTWEWQRSLIADTRKQLADTLASWR